MDLVSPYFVPGNAGTEALIGPARRGVRVRVLTSSLAGTGWAERALVNVVSWLPIE